MTSTDGFCSVVVFSPGELGTVYTGPLATASTTPTNSNQQSSVITTSISHSPFASTSATAASTRIPASPVRSLSSSSINTVTSISQYPNTDMVDAVNTNPTPLVSSLPGVSSNVTGSFGVTMATPPMTPASSSSTMQLTGATPSASTVLGKRDTGASTSESGSVAATMEIVGSRLASTGADEVTEADKGGDKKRRRIAPTPVTPSELLRK